MAEGPVNFGKPVGILVLLGCIGGGVYAYMNWPAVYEQREGPHSYWSVSWPHDWERRLRPPIPSSPAAPFEKRGT